MKKLIKILPIIMTVMMVLMVASPVFATDDVFGKIQPSTNTTGGDKFIGAGNQILGVVRVVGTIISVGVLMVLGIKYMMGSAEEKAEYKKTFIPYIVGVALLFAATMIAPAIAGFFMNMQ